MNKLSFDGVIFSPTYMASVPLVIYAFIHLSILLSLTTHYLFPLFFQLVVNQQLSTHFNLCFF